MEPENITIRGAQQHNLRHIDVTIPRYRMVVLTGVSGSGKSSLAFDTLYAEGQRRYVESLSSYARQFLGQMEKPKVDYIGGLSPAIAIEQKAVSKNPRSTVGTVTEVMDYLRVLYARVGTPHCPECGRAVQPQSAQQIADQLAALPPGTRLQLLAPVARQRKGTHADLIEEARRDGYVRARIDGVPVDLSRAIKLAKTKKHTIELIVDRLIIPNPGSPNPELPESGASGNSESGDSGEESFLARLSMPLDRSTPTSRSAKGLTSLPQSPVPHPASSTWYCPSGSGRRRRRASPISRGAWYFRLFSSRVSKVAAKPSKTSLT